MPNSSTVFDVASLHKLRPEIESTLSTLEHHLGDFVDDASTSYLLAESVESMLQMQSVLALIKLTGSQEITQAIVDALNHLVETKDHTQKELIYSLSEGVMTLNRYIEFVLLRERLFPNLLLTAVNNIRLSLAQPLLGESAFDPANAISDNADAAFTPVMSMPNSAKLLQKTYRLGLNAALRNKSTQPSPEVLSKIKLMEAACQKAQQKVGGQFWNVAVTAVADIEKMLPLSASRMRTLAFLENQFVSGGQVNKDRFADLINMAASRSSVNGAQLREKLNLNTLDDNEYRELYNFMYGPNKDVVDTVNDLIQEEITACKDMVDTEARKEQPEAENFKKIAIALRDLSLRLFTLGLQTAAGKVMEQAKAVSTWQTAQPEQFEGLLTALLYAENATILMVKNHTPGLTSLPLNNTGISLHQLDTAFDELVKESRSTLSNAVASLTSYMNAAEKDLLHLANLPTMLSSVGGALLFVDVSKGHKLLDHASKYVKQKINQGSHFNEDQLAKLGDIIMSADFYLESIELKQPSGDSPLIIGARSLKSLLTAA